MHHVPVRQCDVTRCCFNDQKQCRAKAIQVGDHLPRCDTFNPTGSQCGLKDSSAEIGVCKVTECRFNDRFLCQASAVNVGWKDNLAECLTYQHR